MEHKDYFGHSARKLKKPEYFKFRGNDCLITRRLTKRKSKRRQVNEDFVYLSNI